VAAVTGLEKFSHLEDKIYRTIELCKTLRQQRDELEQEVTSLRQQVDSLKGEKDQVGEQLERMLAERDEIRVKVEGMLDAIAIIDPEFAEAARK
jgi:uncharacterized coiled-coil DUF342 family protein